MASPCLGVGQVVAAHAVLVLDVADHRFDCRAPSHLAFDGRCHVAFLACGVDLESVAQGGVVALVS